MPAHRLRLSLRRCRTGSGRGRTIGGPLRGPRGSFSRRQPSRPHAWHRPSQHNLAIPRRGGEDVASLRSVPGPGGSDPANSARSRWSGWSQQVRSPSERGRPALAIDAASYASAQTRPSGSDPDSRRALERHRHSRLARCRDPGMETSRRPPGREGRRRHPNRIVETVIGIAHREGGDAGGVAGGDRGGHAGLAARTGRDPIQRQAGQEGAGENQQRQHTADKSAAEPVRRPRLGSRAKGVSHGRRACHVPKGGAATLAVQCPAAFCPGTRRRIARPGRSSCGVARITQRRRFGMGRVDRPPPPRQGSASRSSTGWIAHGSRRIGPVPPERPSERIAKASGPSPCRPGRRRRP